MGIWIHKITNKDIYNKKGDCSFCGKVNIIYVYTAWRCINSRTQQRGGKAHLNKLYRRYFFNIPIKKKCSKCEIQNDDLRFFDVNHIDGDHDNNKRENLELLCPNCHRIETLKQWEENKMIKYNRNYKKQLSLN